MFGLQFGVLSLSAERPLARSNAAAGSAFATPTIVHFGMVLGLSAILRAPWDGVGAPAVVWGILGLAGVVYSIVVILRMRRQGAYRPVFEDWLFHVLLPLAAYLTLAVTGYVARFRLRDALFGVGAAA